MKRSEINAAIRRMESLLDKCSFALPPFCRCAPEEWNSRFGSCREICDNMLGWDVTDYGLSDFPRLGMTLITLRNGNARLPKYGKPYAEKIMMLLDGQVSPMHFHWFKMEDIINRGGGKLSFALYNSDEGGGLADSDVTVYKDGETFTVHAGDPVILSPGESLTLLPLCYHEFTPVPGTGDVLIGEVSMTNDDTSDNRFLRELGRFPKIEEDEPPYRLLCTEYPK